MKSLKKRLAKARPHFLCGNTQKTAYKYLFFRNNSIFADSLITEVENLTN